MSREIEKDGFITRAEDLKKSEPAKQKSMVLIKNLEMPESCSMCRLKDMYYGECNVKHKKIKTFIVESGKPSWCPLTEVEVYGPEGTLYKEM